LTESQRSVSIAVAAMLFCAAMLAAVVGARAVAHSDSVKARLSFNLASAEIASTLKLAIQQEEGLVISASAYVASNPQGTPKQFDRWAASVRALQRYPELQDMGLIVLVPARRLATFKARMLANSILPASRQPPESRGRFDVVPQGKRSYYCFAATGIVRSTVATLQGSLATVRDEIDALRYARALTRLRFWSRRPGRAIRSMCGLAFRTRATKAREPEIELAQPPRLLESAEQ